MIDVIDESSNCLSYFGIKYNHLKRFLICGPAPCPHLLPLLWTFQALTLPETPAPMAGMCPGTLLCSGVWWPSGLFFASSSQASVPHCAPLSASAVHFIPCVTLAKERHTEHSVARILWHRQQPTTLWRTWRSLTAMSSKKTPRLQRRGQFIQNNI